LTTNLKFGIGLSNLEKRLELQKIGILLSEIIDDKMQFVIELNTDSLKDKN
jgi:hypothetical protein